jgi:hypothetical protein
MPVICFSSYAVTLNIMKSLGVNYHFKVSCFWTLKSVWACLSTVHSQLVYFNMGTVQVTVVRSLTQHVTLNLTEAVTWKVQHIVTIQQYGCQRKGNILNNSVNIYFLSLLIPTFYSLVLIWYFCVHYRTCVISDLLHYFHMLIWWFAFISIYLWWLHLRR